MKIAILSFWSGEINRGVETWAHNLANELTKRGHLVTIYQKGGKLDGAKYETVALATHYDYNKPNNSTLPFLNYTSLKVLEFTHKASKKIEKDTQIVITTSGQFQSLYMRIWTFLKGIKHIVVGQSGAGLDDRINLYTFPDAYVALSEYQKKWANRINPYVKSYKITNGVSPDIIPSKKYKRTDFGLPGPIILTVGALVGLKRHDLTIKAVSKLEKGSLLIVGSGEEKKNLEELATKLIPNRFKIMDFKYSEIHKAYSSADVFVFATSPWESFGNVIVEALAFNLPVVVPDDPIRKEIVDGSGILVDPKDSEEFAGAIKKALQKKWGTIPRERSRSFDFRIISEEYEKLFKELTS